VVASQVHPHNSWIGHFPGGMGGKCCSVTQGISCKLAPNQHHIIDKIITFPSAELHLRERTRYSGRLGKGRKAAQGHCIIRAMRREREPVLIRQIGS